LKRILVIHDEDLFTAGLSSLLSREMDFDVVCTTSSNGSDLAYEIEEFQPSVVVMDGRAQGAVLNIILELMRDQSGLRLVIVDEKDNIAHIFDKRLVVVTHGTDLIDAVRMEQDPGDFSAYLAN
jgi:DNA-binding NarL/FixJ family response regulator